MARYLRRLSLIACSFWIGCALQSEYTMGQPLKCSFHNDLQKCPVENWQTKEASCSGGIHHSFFCQGLSSFFLMSVGRSHAIPSRQYPTLPFYQQAYVRSTAHDLLELGYNIGRSNELLRLRGFFDGEHWSPGCDTRQLQNLLPQNVS